MLSESSLNNNKTFLRRGIDTPLPCMGLLLKLLWETGTSCWRTSSPYIWGHTEAAPKRIPIREQWLAVFRVYSAATMLSTIRLKREEIFVKLSTEFL